MGIPLKNIVKMGAYSVSARFLGQRRPLNVMLAVTDRCSGHCKICKIPSRKSPEMTLDEIRNMLDETAGMGCQRLGIWGGEPLMRQDLGQIIHHAKGLGLFVTVDTNGHLITKREEAIKEADHLNISLDGPKDAHDKVRGEGMFDKVMAAIEHCAGRYEVWTITVLTSANLDKIDWLMETAVKYGFKTTFQPLHHNEQLGCNQEFRPDDDKLRQAFTKLLALKKQGAPIASSEKYLRAMIQWPDYGKTRIKDPGRKPPCMAGLLYVNVDVDGSLYPCSLYVDELKAPNVRDSGFAAAFEKMGTAPCDACIAACFTEYNLLYALDFQTGINWVRALR